MRYENMTFVATEPVKPNTEQIEWLVRVLSHHLGILPYSGGAEVTNRKYGVTFLSQ